MGWQSEPIDLTKWIEEYCTARYGLCNDNIAEAWRLLCGSVYGSLYSYPRFLWQTVVPDNRRKSLHEINDDFGQAVELLLRASEECGPSQLYQNDVIEFGSLWIGELADRHYRKALNALDNHNQREAARQLDLTINLLQQADGILAAHPLYRLSNWVDAARSATDNVALKNRYEANAKRLISVWGGFQEDYAARFWNGMIPTTIFRAWRSTFRRAKPNLTTGRKLDRDPVGAFAKQHRQPDCNTQTNIFTRMKRHRLLAWAAALTATLLASTSCNKGAVQTVFSIYQQEQAARGLIERTVGEDYAQFFAVEIVPNVQEANDWFELSTKSGKIVLRGNNGISVASALNHYLKESCNCHISWCGDNMTLPEVLPLQTENVRRESPYKYRYYLNYCTLTIR